MKNQFHILKEISKHPVLMFAVSFLIFFLGLAPIRADNVITSGTNVRINSGIIVTTMQNVLVENGGKLTNEGSLILKNSFTNQNTVDDLGIGTMEFSGTTPQSLAGQNTLGGLVVNNTAGLDLTGNTTLNAGLSLQNGHIRLGTSNLTLGSTATVTDTPSATAMVIATGTGELRKSFSGTGAFTFPVGDNTGTAEFTPVTLTFTNGTFATGNYAGVKLTNSAYPGYAGNNLNRYWSLTQNGISGSRYDAVFQYAPADFSGNENGLYCVQMDPSPEIYYNLANTTLHQLTASGLTTFGVFTGIASIIQDILLNSGWNIASAYVNPNNPDLKTIFQPLIDAAKLKKVMDEAGKTIENFGAFGGWKNNIGNLNPAKGYKVNVTEVTTLSLEGIPVQLPLDNNLQAGWNIISYPCTTLQDAKALVQPLIDSGKLKKVMDEAGKTIENFGAFGGWKNNIGNFLPGKGYKVNVTETCTLTIPRAATKLAMLLPEVLPSFHFTKIFEGNGTEHMNIHVLELASSGLQAGDEIGIFDGKYCVGGATIGEDQMASGNISIPASCNDGMAKNVNGFTSGHPIGIQVFRGKRSYKTEKVVLQGTDSFEKNGSLFVKVIASDLPTVQISNGSDQMKCYPNPFSDQLTIEIQLFEPRKLDVKIYDLTGKLIRSLFSGKAGKSETLFWDGTNGNGAKVISGTYILKANEMIEKIALKK